MLERLVRCKHFSQFAKLASSELILETNKLRAVVPDMPLHPSLMVASTAIAWGLPQRGEPLVHPSGTGLESLWPYSQILD
jgi:hypothetical protein